MSTSSAVACLMHSSLASQQANVQKPPAHLKSSRRGICRTELHFVRCIKPNGLQVAATFDAPLTLHQLRCCGVLEVTRIARAGYPTRYLHRNFAERYHVLLHGAGEGGSLRSAFQPVPSAPWTQDMCVSSCLSPSICCVHSDWEGRNPLEVCKELLQEFRIPPDMYQIGRTKLFFRAGVLGHLEDTSARINRCAHPAYMRATRSPAQPPAAPAQRRIQMH